MIKISAHAQEQINFTDTFQIHELSVVSNVTGKYQAGLQEIKFDDDQLQLNNGSSLEQLLSRYTAIYLRSDAGGLSTIRIRGTSADHTAVTVGGLKVNSLTLGESNYSNIPIALFDNLNVRIGSSSVETGSGSIGGTVNLGLNNQWTEGSAMQTAAGVGSFGEYSLSSKIFAGNGNFESVTRFYVYQKENDFPFQSNAYDYELGDYPTETQRYASLVNRGLLQEFNYKFSSESKLTNFIWLENDKHESQPNFGENHSESYDSRWLEEQNIRTWSEYTTQIGTKDFRVGLGYVHDKTIDYASKDETIGTDRIVQDLEMGFQLPKKGKLKVGYKYKYIVPSVYSYDDDLTEQQLDVYTSYYQRFLDRVQLTVNLREALVSRYKPQFAPGLGLDVLIFTTPHTALSALGNASLSFRIPTFNDRYWGDQGNPDLKPEVGTTFESGLKYTICSNQTSLNFRAQAYHMDVENWLLWKPGIVPGSTPPRTDWIPENVQRVVSQGVDFTMDANIVLASDMLLTGGVNYGFNSCVRKESLISDDKLNQQLEYVPQNTASGWITLNYKDYSISIDGKYTGWRYYTQSSILDAYTLLNAEFAYQIKMNRQKVRLSAQCMNMMNTSYQNIYYYAMPGRSFRISAQWNLNRNYN